MTCPIDGSSHHNLREHLAYIALPLTLLGAIIGGAAGLTLYLLGIT